MTSAPFGFLDQLEAYGEVTRRAALADLSPEGMTDHLLAPMAEYLGRGGKGLRPALCLATCEAFGGTVDDALPSARALELLHNAFLVHDDIEDGSELRRGRPTLHHIYGQGLALNAGDGLAVFALGALRANDRLLGRRLAARIWNEFEFMARQTVEGQAMELGWQREGRCDLTPDDYLDLIMKKTCWYSTVLPLRVGALIGARRDVDLTPMLRFGFFLGAAFQIRDDLLNLVGSPDLYGKEPLGDLWEGKRTLMILHLLAAAAPDERRRVETYLAQDRRDRSDETITEVMSMLRSHGSIAFAEEFARGIAQSAAAAFEDAFAGVADSAPRRFVREMVEYMVERDR